MRFNLKTARRLKGYSPQDMADKLDRLVLTVNDLVESKKDKTYLSEASTKFV